MFREFGRWGTERLGKEGKDRVTEHGESGGAPDMTKGSWGDPRVKAELERIGLAKKFEEPESGILNPDASSEGPPTDVFNPSDEEIKKFVDQIDKNATVLEGEPFSEEQ